MTTPSGAAPGPNPGDDALGLWMAARQRAEAEREATLASDADRDSVCQLLNQAFSQGRLTTADLDERTSRALAARTHGDLEEVLAGLVPTGGPALWTTRPQGGVVPRIIFWGVAIFSLPMAFFGFLFLLAGNDAGDRIFGIVLMVLFLPGPIALYRWAHPRT